MLDSRCYFNPASGVDKRDTHWKRPRCLYLPGVIVLAILILSCDSPTDPQSGTTPQDEFRKDYIEAIFLGSGPLVPQDGFTACVTHSGRWAAFPRGTTIRVIVSNTLDQGSDGVDTKRLIEEALETVSAATLGNIQTVFKVTDDPDPIPGLNEVTATDHPSPQDTGCPFDRGCVHVQFLDSAFTVMRSSKTLTVRRRPYFVVPWVRGRWLTICSVTRAPRQWQIAGRKRCISP